MGGDLPECPWHNLLLGYPAIPLGLLDDFVAGKISGYRTWLLPDGGWHRALGRTSLLPGNSLVLGRVGADAEKPWLTLLPPQLILLASHAR
jgi:hypothetical protein